MSDETSTRTRRELKRRNLHRAQRHTLLACATLIGAVVGAVGVIFQVLVARVQDFGISLAQTATSHGFSGGVLLVTLGAALGALAGWLTERFAPEAAGSGIPHVKATLMNLRQVIPERILPVKFIAGLAALGAGMSLGREGPTIQIGAALGKLVARIAHIPRRSHRTLVASAAGAGLASAFNAPLAGFLFVMEELRREMSAMTYGAALLCSVAAVAVTRLCLGQDTSFHLNNPPPVSLSGLLVVAFLGLVCAAAGVAFNRGLIRLLDVRKRLKTPRWIAAGVLGGLASLLLAFYPNVTGGGHSVAEGLLSGGFAQATLLSLATLFVAKLLLTITSYGTGVPGGIFAPILVLGAVLGYFVGKGANDLIPHLGVSAEVLASVGMVGLLTASVRAPLTGVVLIVEMTGEYNLLYAFLVAAFFADIASELIKNQPIYEWLLERDLHVSHDQIASDGEPNVLELLIEPDSYMDGRAIKNLGMPHGALILSIERERRVVVPQGATHLREGDFISVMVEGDQDALVQIHDMAKGP